MLRSFTIVCGVMFFYLVGWWWDVARSDVRRKPRPVNFVNNKINYFRKTQIKPRKIISQDGRFDLLIHRFWGESGLSGPFFGTSTSRLYRRALSASAIA
jgi:hypothetical protein